MNEPKDNKPVANKIIGILIGSLFALVVFSAMHSGRVSIGKRSSRTYYYVAHDPGVFWLVVGFYATISIFMFWFAFRSSKK